LLERPRSRRGERERDEDEDEEREDRRDWARSRSAAIRRPGGGIEQGGGAQRGPPTSSWKAAVSHAFGASQQQSEITFHR
jgi:hypothetical protein